jgi:transcriptional regulator with XRE-family HTH domain
MDIAEILAKKLEEKGWSQNRLAQKSGVTQVQVNRIVRGLTVNVQLETLRALARALDCATVDLLPDQDKRRYSRAA